MLLEGVKAGYTEITYIRRFMVFVWSLVVIKRKQDMHVSCKCYKQLLLYRQKLRLIHLVWSIPQCNTKIGIWNQTCRQWNSVSETAQDFARNNLVPWSYSLISIGKLIDVNGAGLSPCRITCSNRERCLCNPFFNSGWLINRLMRTWIPSNNNLTYLFYNDVFVNI